MTRIRLDYIHRFRDRHGKLRHYARPPGRKRVPLPGLPGSDEFMEAYQRAMSGEAAPREIGAARTKPGTFNALIVAYYNSPNFKQLAAETQRTRRSTLERFRSEKTDTGLSVGDCRVAHLSRGRFERMVAAKASTPAAARNFLKTIRGLMQFAISLGMRADDPTRDVRSAKIRTDGFPTWTEADIETFEALHPIGTRARLALALLLYTAQRRSDVVRMGRQHLRDGWLHFRQQKTGEALAIPVHPILQQILESTPSEHLTYLTTKAGQPFSPAGFTNWFREMCNEAGLPRGRSAHGLRKAACRRLAEAGCSANLIAAVSGHKSLREVQRYTAAADQARMAKSAIETITGAFSVPTRRTSVGKPK
jgi:integrase